MQQMNAGKRTVNCQRQTAKSLTIRIDERIFVCEETSHNRSLLLLTSLEPNVSQNIAVFIQKSCCVAALSFMCAIFIRFSPFMCNFWWYFVCAFFIIVSDGILHKNPITKHQIWMKHTIPFTTNNVSLRKKCEKNGYYYIENIGIYGCWYELFQWFKPLLCALRHSVWRMKVAFHAILTDLSSLFQQIYDYSWNNWELTNSRLCMSCRHASQYGKYNAFGSNNSSAFSFTYANEAVRLCFLRNKRVRNG